MNKNETIRIDIDIDDRDLRNLNSIISDLQSTLNDLNGTLSASMSQVQDITRGFNPLGEAFGIANSTLDTLQRTLSISTISFENIDKTIEFLTGTKKAFTTATNISRVAVDKKTASMGIATGVATGLKWAMKAIPFVGAIAIIGSLISTMGRWIRSSNDAIDATDELSEKIEDNRVAHAERRYEIQNEITANRSLIRELRELHAQESLNHEQHVRSIQIIRELNDNIDGLSFTYDTLTGRLDANGQAAFDLADHYIHLEFATKTLLSNQDRLNHITEEYPLIAPQLVELQEELSGTYKWITSHIDGGQTLNQRYLTLQDSIAYLEEKQASYREELEKLENQNYQMTTNMVKLWEDLAWHHSQSFETMTDSQREVVNGFKDMFEISSRYLNDLTREFTYNNDLTWEAVQANQERMIKATDEHSRLYAELVAAGVSEAYLEAIGADSVRALPLLREMQNDGIDTILDRQGEWKDAHEANADTMIDAFEFNATHANVIRNYVLDGVRGTFQDALEESNFREMGESVPNGFIEGVSAGEAGIIASMNSVVDAVNIIKDLLGINSPSRVFKGYGENTIQGLIQGIESLQAQSKNSMQQVAQNMLRVYQNANREYTNIGRDAMSGLNQGLQSGESGVMATARRIADNVARTMRNALQINSPSRVMREDIGRQIPAGVAAGIDKYADYALDSVYDLGKELTQVDFPNLNDIINAKPRLNLASASNSGINSTDNSITNNYEGMFKGANFSIDKDQDVDRIMQLMARKIRQDRMSLKRRY